MKRSFIVRASPQFFGKRIAICLQLSGQHLDVDATEILAVKQHLVTDNYGAAQFPGQVSLGTHMCISDA